MLKTTVLINSKVLSKMNAVILFFFIICVSYCSLATRSLNLEILKQLYSNKSLKQGVFSTLSVRLTYGMLLKGAKDKTALNMRDILFGNATKRTIQKGMSQLMKYYAHESKGYSMAIANLLLLQENFRVNPNFEKSLKKIYNATVNRVPFTDETINFINDFVSNATNGTIEEMIETLDPQTRLMVLNALYFKGEWLKKFDKSQTTDDTFYNDDGTETEIKFMADEREMLVLTAGKYEVGIIPYIGNVSLYIFLSRSGYTLENALNDLPHDLSFDVTKRIEKRDILFPKITITSDLDLKKILSTLGMSVPFSEQANFMGITSKEKVYISHSIQKAMIKFDEEGTTAAATTHATGLGRSLPPSFYVNKPFVFAVIDEVFEKILFAGFVRSLAS